jgi:hypothetical protein
MSHFQQHKEFFNKPIYLSEEEKKAPLDVIKEFFADFSLSEIREIHEQIDQACLATDNHPFDEPEERDQLMYFRRKEEKALEAALQLLEQKIALPAVIVQQTTTQPGNATGEEIDLDDLQHKVLDIQKEVAGVVLTVVKAASKASLRRLGLG